MSRAALALELARDAGFDLAGIAPCEPPPDAERFDRWLESGRQADLDYLVRERERIVDPRRLFPRGQSILIVGLAHSRAPVELPGGGKIARYAAGRDYHNWMLARLRGLARKLSRAGLGGDRRIVVDAGPLMERSHAARAGLGFPSKAANLLHPSFGPWFFLGEIVLEAQLEPTVLPPAGSCGTCTACIDACPTTAIVAPGVVDARRCISYHTIENRGPIPRELRQSLGGWVFGCDVCSEVCPWGRAAPDRSSFWGRHPQVERRSLIALLADRTPLAGRWTGSPIQRAGREGLARNAALALVERPTEEGRLALLEALSFDPSALVREAAGWSLSRGHSSDAGTREALARAAAREPEHWAAAELLRSHEELAGGGRTRRGS